MRSKIMTARQSKTHTQEPAPKTTGATIRWAKRYDAVVRLMALGQDKAFRRMTAEMAHIKTGDTVLEVGCGTGELTIVAKEHAGSSGKVYGIDASPEMIEVARSKIAADMDIEFRVDLIERLSFTDDSFDVVLSSLMMHHLPDDLKRKGLDEVFRVLKPGGQIFVVDIKRPTTPLSRAVTALLGHGNIHTGTQDLPTLMKAIGFTNIQTGDTRFPLIGFVRGEATK
jgi:ubiquinone/menaquinone biosynthesis C-methylase UbiE